MSYPAPHRQFRLPRVRFSLKTAFVLITALCVWLGYNVYVFQNRKALRRMIAKRHLILLDCRGVESRLQPTNSFDKMLLMQADAETRAFVKFRERYGKGDAAARELNTVRRLLGDVPVAKIVLKYDGDLETIREAFPEAAVSILGQFDPEITIEPATRVDQKRRNVFVSN